jgi:hypothetical protein
VAQGTIESLAGKDAMVFKPNYNQQRAERNRAKEAKKEAKRAEQEEQVARRKREQASGGEQAAAEAPAPSERNGA